MSPCPAREDVGDEEGSPPPPWVWLSVTVDIFTMVNTVPFIKCCSFSGGTVLDCVELTAAVLIVVREGRERWGSFHLWTFVPSDALFFQKKKRFHPKVKKFPKSQE